MKQSERQDLIKKTGELIDKVSLTMDTLRKDLDNNNITWVEYEAKRAVWSKLQATLYLEIQLLSEIDELEDES